MIVLGASCVKPVAEVIKNRFGNLTVMETIEMATAIITAINKQLKKDEEEA